MEIKVGHYTLKSDRFSCFITEEVKQENGKIGHRRVTGFHRDMGSLLDDFIDTKAKDSDATELKQVLAEIEDALKIAKQIARASVKAGFQIVRKARAEK